MTTHQGEADFNRLTQYKAAKSSTNSMKLKKMVTILFNL